MKTTDALLSPENARARTEGRKTQHRVLIKLPAHRVNAIVWDDQPDEGEPGWFARDVDTDGECWHDTRIKCPYGQPGDRIRWLTTWAVRGLLDHDKPMHLSPSIPIWSCHDSATKPDGFGKLRPGLSVPSFLRDRMPVDELIAVRAERLQDISEEDAKAEGVHRFENPFGLADRWKHYGVKRVSVHSPIDSYITLWDRINGPGSWDLNSWVWVLEWRNK